MDITSFYQTYFGELPQPDPFEMQLTAPDSSYASARIEVPGKVLNALIPNSYLFIYQTGSLN